MRTALIAIALLMLAACTPLCGRAPAATGPTDNLVFTGPAPGTLTSATSTCSFNTNQANVDLQGALAGKPLDLNIHIGGYAGPKTYSVGSLLDGAGEVRLQVGVFNADSTTGAGTVTVDTGERSGSLKADLIGGERVIGVFVCDSTTVA